MELKDLSTEKLIEELEKREKIRVYDMNEDRYTITIKKLYSMPICTCHVHKVILLDN